MIVHVCSECLPEVLPSFDGPEDHRECIVCGKAELCRDVNPADAIRVLLGPPPKAAGGGAPPSPPPPGAPPLTPLPPPAPPVIPAPPGAMVSQ